MRNVVRGEELTTNYRQDHISDFLHSILIWYTINPMQDWIVISSTFLATLLARYPTPVGDLVTRSFKLALRLASLFIRNIIILISITGTTSTRVQTGSIPSTACDKSLQKLTHNQTRLKDLQKVVRHNQTRIRNIKKS